MIQKQSLLNIVDNSGANKAQTIHIYNGYKRRYAKSADIVKITVKSTRKKSVELLKIKKGDLSKAIITTVKTFNRKKDGELKSYNKNTAVLISDQNKYLSSKIVIPVDFNVFRQTKYCKLLRISRKKSF